MRVQVPPSAPYLSSTSVELVFESPACAGLFWFFGPVRSNDGLLKLLRSVTLNVTLLTNLGS